MRSQIVLADTQTLGRLRRQASVVVPSDLGHRVGQFLQPGIVRRPPVEQADFGIQHQRQRIARGRNRQLGQLHGAVVERLAAAPLGARQFDGALPQRLFPERGSSPIPVVCAAEKHVPASGSRIGVVSRRGRCGCRRRSACVQASRHSSRDRVEPSGAIVGWHRLSTPATGSASPQLSSQWLSGQTHAATAAVSSTCCPSRSTNGASSPRSSSPRLLAAGQIVDGIDTRDHQHADLAGLQLLQQFRQRAVVGRPLLGSRSDLQRLAVALQHVVDEVADDLRRHVLAVADDQRLAACLPQPIGQRLELCVVDRSGGRCAVDLRGRHGLPIPPPAGRRSRPTRRAARPSVRRPCSRSATSATRSASDTTSARADLRGRGGCDSRPCTRPAKSTCPGSPRPTRRSRRPDRSGNAGRRAHRASVGGPRQSPKRTADRTTTWRASG